MEAAIAVGTLVAVLALVLAVMGAMVVQLRCVDAAAEAARLASRGDTEGARRAVTELLPAGTEVGIDVRTDDVRVRVRAAPLGGALPGVRVGADAVAAREPDQVAPTLGSGSAVDPGTDGAGVVPDAEPGAAEATSPTGSGPDGTTAPSVPTTGGAPGPAPGDGTP